MVGMPKAAVCLTAAGIFYIVNARTGVSVYAGRLSRAAFDKDSGDNVRIADFSDFNSCGRFFIRAGYRRSDVFEISEKPYSFLKKTVIHGVYLNRCGYDFTSEASELCRDDTYAHIQCHTEELTVYGDESTHCIDVSGGWHDCGGYGRNTVSACIALAHMLYSLRLFPENFTADEKQLITDECRWGLKWLLKMQTKDGGVYSKTGTLSSGDFVSPDDDSGDYYIFRRTTRAAAHFTAVTALASGFFANDKKLSQAMRRAAERSWLWLVQTGEYEEFMNHFLGEETSPDGRLTDADCMWALCEMYSLTGDECFSEPISRKHIMCDFCGFSADNTGGFAALSYLLCDRKKEREVESCIRKKITDSADRMWLADRSSGYRCSCTSASDFTYGSNVRVVSDCMSFITAYLLSGDRKYLTGATDQLAYIFGHNPNSVSYMTGVSGGCMRPYHICSVTDNIEAPVAGMLVSGANVERNDGYSRWHIEKDTPAAKCYVDNEFSFSTNEPAVHYSTPMIFISGFYEKVGRSALAETRD